MNDDVLFFVLIGVGFFVLWAVTGGPTRPISYAGAYITPITNVNPKQVGYGPKLNLSGTIAIGNASAAINGNGVAPAVSGSDSLYKNQVIAVRSNAPSPTDSSNAFVHLMLSSRAQLPIRISHWRFTSVANNAMVIISNTDASLDPRTSTTVVTAFPSTTLHDTITLEDAGGKVVSSFSY